jgi:mannose-1-phosphate guanylyltransferase
MGGKNKNISTGKNIYPIQNNNTFIYNTTGLNVAVVGVNNCIIVLTKNGLLVMNKNKEDLIGQVVKNIKK